VLIAAIKIAMKTQPLPLKGYETNSTRTEKDHNTPNDLGGKCAQILWDRKVKEDGREYTSHCKCLRCRFTLHFPALNLVNFSQKCEREGYSCNRLYLNTSYSWQRHRAVEGLQQAIFCTLALCTLE